MLKLNLQYCPADGKSQLTGKDPDVGNDWGQEEKEMAEDEMARLAQWTWFEQIPGGSEG